MELAIEDSQICSDKRVFTQFITKIKIIILSPIVNCVSTLVKLNSSSVFVKMPNSLVRYFTLN